MVATESPLPCPAFEGSEKRIEVTFDLCADAPASGLRALSRAQLDAVCQAAACEIVSRRSNAWFDGYVLSESSMFVYPDRIVLKTCGTTKLLDAVPLILRLAEQLGATPARVKYSRASFLFPHQQPAPYISWDGEVAFLQRHFGGLGGGCSAYVLGDALCEGLQWHVYVADSGTRRAPKALHTVEVAMTGLCPAKAARFFRTDRHTTAVAVTEGSGIRALVPGADVDDYVFDPCGYSMNGLEGEGFITIHVTPEDHCSYASVEFCGYPPAALGDLGALVAQTMAIFGPARASVALSTDGAGGGAWADAFSPPGGYVVGSAAAQGLRGGGTFAHFHLDAAPGGGKGSEPGSPRSVLKQLPSVATLASMASSASGLGWRGGAQGDSDTDGSSDSAAMDCGEALGERLESCCSMKDGGAPKPPAAKAPPPPPLKHAPPPLPPLEALEPSLADFLTLYDAAPLASGGAEAVAAHAHGLVRRYSLEDSFYVYDLGVVLRLYRAWAEAMPRVTPFYAVKCNTDKALIGLLARLGAGFDCASDAEVAAVLEAGVDPGRIVYANACKRPRDIKGAAARGVNLTTFDSACELEKLAAWHPRTRALLRIRADDPAARCQLGNKYGAEEAEWPALFKAARRCKIEVVGVSFHVGSGATNPAAFGEAIAAARRAFDLGAAAGYAMGLLDIGGGFAGGRFSRDGRVDLEGVPAAVNAALEAHFPPSAGVRVIAEPGRYFAEAMATYATMVFGTRSRPTEVGGEGWEYWVTDGLYGGMNSVLYDHATLEARVLRSPHLPPLLGPPGPDRPSTVFGPTCDGLDTLLRGAALPELRVGDWLLWPNFGAYTSVGASDFNGIEATAARVFYVYSGAPTA